MISPPHHGRGYATAIGEALIVFGLNTLGLNRILAACNPANVASEHILREKLGMRFEREVEPRPGFRRRVYSSVGASEIPFKIQAQRPARKTLQP